MHMCDEFANRYSVANTSKSFEWCNLVETEGYLRQICSSPLDFHVGDDIELFSEWPRLDNIISNHCPDDADIVYRRICRPMGKLILFCVTLESCLRL